MAQYLVLLYDDEAAWAKATEQDSARILEGHNQLPGEAEKLNVKILNGNALQPTNTATTLRGDVVTDGPFAETKEAIGGYYLVEAPDLDKALAFAKLVPNLDGGSEVRPIMVY
ncbi:MAG: YciI family protein [Actinocrinis sp.]